MSSRCVECGAPVFWVSTSTGQRLPLDVDPHPEGFLMMLPNGRVRLLPHEERAACPAPLFRSHFVTCRLTDDRKYRGGRT